MRVLSSSLLMDKVRDETREAMQKGYRSTPTFTLNGERIQYAGLEQMRQLLLAELGQSGESPADHGGTSNEVMFGI